MEKQPFNQDWRFRLGSPNDWGAPAADESWRRVDLPHDWSIEMDRDPKAPNGASVGFFPMGRGYYQKTITAPEAWRGKKVLVEFEGIYMNAEAWLNENFLGRHPYGYTSFLLDLTPYLRIGKENALRIQVDNTHQGNSRWYSGSGIYRPAWLYVAEPVHVAHWGTWVRTEEVSERTATVQVQTRVMNESETDQNTTVSWQVYGPDDQLTASMEAQAMVAAGAEQAFVHSNPVTDPLLWAPETPALYRLETRVAVGEKTVDTVTTVFGIRSIAWNAEQGFLLNGAPIKMKGGCVHHDNGVLGAASYPRSEERKVALHKASGYNAIRCAHNPPAPSFLDACDRLGMLVIDEAFDCWREGKKTGDYHVVFDDWWERDLESMVLRDRNHPSVVVWSIGNEVLERDGRSNGAGIARMLAEKVRALDATRPVTAAICHVWDKERQWTDTDGVFAALDIGGYNYEWKTYEQDHERWPERVMFGTESFPLEAFENWMSVLEHSYVVGDFVWTSMDYLGESGLGRQHYETGNVPFLGEYPWHQANCGDIDLAGFKRPQSFYRDMVWENTDQTGTKLFIAVHYPVPEGMTPQVTRWGWPDVDANWTWPGREGQTFKIDVYAACEKVELFLNGKSLGAQPAGKTEKHIARFEAPYAPGELNAIGYDGDKPTAEATLVTAGAPEGIRLTPDREVMRAEAGELCFITAAVVDEQGRLNPSADQILSFTAEGAGEIAAVGSGDPTSMERYHGSQRRAYRGRCVVVVKANGQPGAIRLHAQSEGLTGAAVAIRVE